MKNINIKNKKINMKKLYLIIVGCLLFLSQASANNLVLGTTQYLDSYTSGGVTYKALRFTIAWDNSWSITTGPANWDGVWLFIKRQNCSGTNNWVHQKLGTTAGDHIAKNGAGTTSPEVQVDPVSDGMGVFIRRYGSNVTGSVPTTTVWLKLDVSTSGTNPSSTMSSQDNFQIYGIEMVYVPQGSFNSGDGRNPNSNNFSNGTANSPFAVTAAVQTAGAGSANNYTALASWGCPGLLPPAFPLGYNGFYSMKYEATTGIFTEFLNTLTYDQQTTLLQEAGSTLLPNVVGSWFNGNNTWAYWTRVTTAGVFNTVPAVFSTQYPWTAEGNVIWRTMIAFLDWSALRPMTEFEFEKACRGNNAGTPNTPVANEYPWGSTQITSAQSSGNLGAINELIYVAGNTGVCQYSYNDPTTHSPMRSGSPATATSNRVQAGATYYGIMEMGGNVYEQCVGGGNGYDYSSFTTINGDGSLTNLGLANVTGWPTYGGTNSGTILRGGGFNCNNTNLIQVSDRSLLAGSTLNSEANNNSRNQVGGRGVRTMSY